MPNELASLSDEELYAANQRLMAERAAAEASFKSEQGAIKSELDARYRAQRQAALQAEMDELNKAAIRG